MSHSRFHHVKACTQTCMAQSLRQAYDYWQDQPGSYRAPGEGPREARPQTSTLQRRQAVRRRLACSYARFRFEFFLPTRISGGDQKCSRKESPLRRSPRRTRQTLVQRPLVPSRLSSYGSRLAADTCPVASFRRTAVSQEAGTRPPGSAPPDIPLREPTTQDRQASKVVRLVRLRSSGPRTRLDRFAGRHREAPSQPGSRQFAIRPFPGLTAPRAGLDSQMPCHLHRPRPQTRQCLVTNPHLQRVDPHNRTNSFVRPRKCLVTIRANPLPPTLQGESDVIQDLGASGINSQPCLRSHTAAATIRSDQTPLLHLQIGHISRYHFITALCSACQISRTQWARHVFHLKMCRLQPASVWRGRARSLNLRC